MVNFNQIIKGLVKSVAIFCFFIVVGCSQSQDDIDLPIYEIGGNVTLPSTLGKTITLDDYKGKVILLNFGYTSCPDICPVVLTRLAKIARKLNDQYGVDNNELQTFFITVDPERDTIEHLRQYIAFFNPNFIALSGSVEQITQVTKQYGVFFEKQTSDNINYQVVHSDKIFLLDKYGRLRGLYGQSNKDLELITAIAGLAKAEM